VSDELNEPVTLAEVKTHLKIDYTTDDTMLNTLIQTARESIEALCNISITEKAFLLKFDKVGEKIQIPKPPCLTIDVVNVYDDDYTKTVIDSSKYAKLINNRFTPSRIVLKRGYEWDYYTNTGEGFEIEFTCGFTTESDYQLPTELKTEILNLIAYWYENRQSETVIPKDIIDKVYKYRVIP